MILRKPYAFLARHFRLIHFILTLLVTYVIFKVSSILGFLNDYLVVTTNVIGRDLVGELFNFIMFFVPVLWFIVSFIILSLMFTKRKPVTFYLVNIVVSVLTFILFIYLRNVISTMEVRVVDLRIIRAMRDIVMIFFFFLIGTLSILIVRATGFDIKKFDFGKDLNELNINDSDREEFEVEFSIDTDSRIRSFRKKIRHTKYFYVENKFLIDLCLALILLIISILLFIKFGIHDKTYNSNNAFSISGINMKIENVYAVSSDYRGNQITRDGYSLIILDARLKNNTSRKKTFDIASSYLEISGHKFYHTLDYRDKLIDLGKTYDNDNLTNDFANYILVYEIPTLYLNRKIVFEYYDKNMTFGLETNHVKVNLNYKSLNKNKDIELEFSKENDLKESVVDASLNIKDFEIAGYFKHNYEFCAKDNECYESVEYIRPSVINTRDKTLLKLNGDIKFNKTIESVYDLYDFVDAFGEIRYTLNGEEKKHDVLFKEVKPNYDALNSEYFIEILSEVSLAEHIELVFNIRNISYHYTLR